MELRKIVMPGAPPKVSVATVTLTSDPPNLERLRAQFLPAGVDGTIELVSAGPVAVGSEVAGPNVNVHRSEINLGGAGGFSLAILAGLARGAEWIWMFDDDAEPLDNRCLSILLAAAEDRKLEVVSPLIVAPENHARLSFPFRVRGRICYERDKLAASSFIPSNAQLFNGALVHRDVFFKVGLPDLQFFLRGDETDFLMRLRQSKIAFGTLTGACVAHPTGEPEVNSIVKHRLAVLIPVSPAKRYYFFRNRGALARKHLRVKSFAADLLLYPFVYLFRRKWDIDGLAHWWGAYSDGLRLDNRRAPHMKQDSQHADQ